MSAKVIVACGSGVATSQTVASKVSRLLEQKGVDAEVTAVDIKDLKAHLKTADAYISVVKTDEHFNVPVFNGISFLTGMNQDEELAKLVSALKK